MAALIRALVNHPNTPPFIAKQLIQKTVTSSPTPGYVARVAAVFKDNGKGVRGDLAAVTRAILLDPEARGARKIDREYGRLREPVLLWTAMLRGLDVTTDGWMPLWQVGNSSQNLFRSPTVFNYYPSDYTLAGGNIPGPEFGDLRHRRVREPREYRSTDSSTTSTSPVREQPERHLWLGCRSRTSRTRPGRRARRSTAFLPDAGQSRRARRALESPVPARDDERRGAQDDRQRGEQAPATESLRRVKMAVNLVLVSVDYQVQK